MIPITDCISVQVTLQFIQDQFYTIQTLQIRGPLLLHKPVTGQELFLLFLTANRLNIHRFLAKYRQTRIKLPYFVNRHT